MPLDLPLESWKWLYEALIYVYETIKQQQRNTTALISDSIPSNPYI